MACGVKLSGRRRESRIDGQNIYDVLYMDIPATEFGNLKN